MELETRLQCAVDLAVMAIANVCVPDPGHAGSHVQDLAVRHLLQASEHAFMSRLAGW